MMKKAFTLVELLAIIAMLGIIMAITLPNVYSIISGSKKQSFEKIVKTIEDKADLYVSDNRENVMAGINAKGFFEITLQTLVDEGLLKEAMNDPRTGENIPLTKKVIIKMSNQVLASCYEDDTCYSSTNYLTLRLNAASASANGATGTYALKNGSNYFVGANPNNWIEFGQVSSSDTTPLMWRIIKNDDEGIKIIYEGTKNGVNPPTADGKIYTAAWDTTDVNKWNRPASLKASLASWYTDLYVVNKESYVKPIKWCIGAVGNGINFSTNQIPTSNFLQYECIDGTYTGGFFNGKTTDTSPVGLIKASDYISASSAATCTGSYYNNSADNYGCDCGKLSGGTITNFLYKSYWWETMNAYSSTANGLVNITGNACVSTTNVGNTGGGIRPVINLNSGISYIGGDGSLADPYRIGLTSGPISDTTSPVITMLGDSTVTIALNSTYVDAGATANDNLDGDITNNITVVSNVNPSVAGTYTITYSVSDRMGNAATQMTRTVKVFAYSYAYDYTGNYQTFVAPVTGNYKVELWGAQGAGAGAGKGAYTKGNINLAANQIVHVYVGQQTATGNATSFNGGTGSDGGPPGGGATDVRINRKYRYVRDYTNGSTANVNNHWVEIQAIDIDGNNVALNKPVTGSSAEQSGYPYTRVTDGSSDTASYATTLAVGSQYVEIDLGQEYYIREIIVWHYYGDGRTYSGTKTVLYSSDRLNSLTINDSSLSSTYPEVAGGNLTKVGYSSRVMIAGGGGSATTGVGGNGGTYTGGNGSVATGGGKTIGGTGQSPYANGYFGVGGNGCGGGGGYYGGGGALCASGGGGGSSFISGVDGYNALTSWLTFTNKAIHYSGYTFSDGIAKSGAEVMPNPRSSGTITGNTGNGYAKITFLPPYVPPNIYGYETNDLILMYDGISNGGIGVHNDNSNVNKGVWKDLSGSDKDGALNGFSYDSSSGWLSNGLLLDGVDDGIFIGDKLSDLFKGSSTIEMVIKFDQLSSRDIILGNYSVANNINWEKYSSNMGRLFWNNGASNILSAADLYPSTDTMQISLIIDKGNNKMKFLTNGTERYSYTDANIGSYNYNWTSGWIGKDSRTTDVPVKGTIYGVRVYNRVLTSSEITKNYNIDKTRYGF